MSDRVLIAGSGVAAVEAVLALRHLAGRNFDIDLVALSHALERLDRERMAAEVETFAMALSHDLIDPADFAG